MTSFEKNLTTTINATMKAAEFYLNNPIVPEHMHHYISGQLKTLDNLLILTKGMDEEHERLKAFIKDWEKLEYA